MKNKVIILAAGKGTRMGLDVPKVLVEINGKPMIEHLLSSVLESGLDKNPIIIVSPDNKEKFATALKDFPVEYVIQEEQLGTGHAVSVARDSVASDVDKIFVFNGDHPFVSSRSMVSLANSHKDKISMMVVELDDFLDWRNVFNSWGRIIKDGDKIKEIIEFKDANDEVKKVLSVNPAIYCFDKNWLFENISALKNNNKQQEYYLTDLIKIAFDQGSAINYCLIDAQEGLGVNSFLDLENAKKAQNLNK